MNKRIQPITALRDTTKLERDLAEQDGIIEITKNGYSDFVILSSERYEAWKSETTKKECPRIEPSHLVTEEHLSDPLGFVKVRSACFDLNVAGVRHNRDAIVSAVKEAVKDDISILCLPELCLTGYTANDLFETDSLLSKSQEAIRAILAETKDIPVLFAFGAPLRRKNSLYNCAFICFQGKILGIVPKTYLPNYSEFYEARWFSPAPEKNLMVSFDGKEIPFGKNLIFYDTYYPDLKIGVELCEDLWVANPPSTKLALNGATVILNLSCSNEIVGKADYRRDLVRMTSARLRSAYVYADAGAGESTTDLVFSGHQLIAEDGTLLAESPLFSKQAADAEIDIEKIISVRRKMTTFSSFEDEEMAWIPFSLPLVTPSVIHRHYAMNPFIPEQKEIDLERVKTILAIQAMGLVKRLQTVHQQKVIVGLSGGLDSTLALLVAVEAFRLAKYDKQGITALTLPSFGTSERTHRNAKLLVEELGVNFREIPLKDTLLSHFKDIGHDPNNHNVTYENAQARERTQVLMDIANDENSLMIGTGDLSELCLGWCTYNGDHMSMYGVNASIPKTLVRYLCEGYALLHPESAPALTDIIATPISPELLPTDKQGQIVQKTEDKVGPYELNDFFIYHFLRFGYRPKKLFFLAKQAYAGVYKDDVLLHWLKSFFSRFFHNQFKRSCLPDGAKVGSVAISPRGDWRMPSDADVSDALEEIDALERAMDNGDR
ncbi:MAG: NAD(+) synthase [Erysipelotrichaceae bacterium]|nr:NAD(+) synthase [Erysipelotrichaceae bacterium]